jgi:hypothetical protein
VSDINPNPPDSGEHSRSKVIELIEQLREETEKAENFIKNEVKYWEKFRPSVFAIAYACAGLEHARALLNLVEGDFWISTWPIVRAQVDAMIWVHEFADSPLDTWLLAELSSVNERESWGARSSCHTDLLKQQAAWNEVLKELKVSRKRDTNSRIESIDVWIRSQPNDKEEAGEIGWTSTWKMLSQSAHMGGNQIGHQMMTKDPSSGKLKVTPRKPPESHTQEFLISESRRTLGFTMFRLLKFCNTICESRDGHAALRLEIANKYNSYLDTCMKDPAISDSGEPSHSLKSARGMLSDVATDVPRDDDRV